MRTDKKVSMTRALQCHRKKILLGKGKEEEGEREGGEMEEEEGVLGRRGAPSAPFRHTVFLSS